MKTIAPLFLLLTFAQASLGQLSGLLSGALGPGEFHVVDTISVEAGDSLTLVPGTTFTFDGPYPFYIYGTLLAEGTENDSIYFTTNLVDSRRRWQGLRFYDDGGSRSALAYCVIQNVVRLTLSGGGVDCYESSPSFSNCTIRGNRSRSGGGAYCWSTSSPTFRECTFVGNSASQFGGGVYCASNSSPHFVECIFETNRARSYGGGVYCQNRSSPTFTNCSITGNEAGSGSQEGGGGIYCESSSIIFSDCTISANHVLGDGSCGGGVYCRNASPTFTNCTINNDSACEGGAVFCREHSSPSFVNCSLSDNLAVRGGGGMTCHESSPSFVHCTFSGNSVSSFGGAAYCYNSSPIFDDCAITDNSGGSGGGVCCRTSSARFTHCFFGGNTAGSYGGGFSGHGCSSNFADCSFSGNSACVGGGVSCSGSSAVFVRSLLDNNSGGTGGGVYCDRSSPTFTSCTITCNEANGDNSQTGDGGGVYCDESSPYFVDCNIVANRTYRHGGGIHCAWASSPSLVNCAISGNSSYGLTGAGGAVHCWRSSPSFTNCALSGNSVNAYGGGVYCNDSSPWLVNCSLSSNTAGLYGGGVYCYDSSPVLVSTIIAFSVGAGIYFVYGPESQFRFCDFYGNDGGTFGGWGGPTRLGELIRTNANGDSCDQYFNILLDPMFVAPGLDDYHLLPDSPCAGAADKTDSPSTDIEGNPRPSPAGTLPDIGAYESGSGGHPWAFNLISPQEGDTCWTPDTTFVWHAPFNPETNDTIRYEVWVDTTSYFTTAWEVAAGLVDTFSHISGLSDDHAFYWTVHASDLNSEGIWAESPLMFHTYFPESPSGFALLSPEDGSQLSPGEVNFCWQAAHDPDPNDIVVYTLHFAAGNTSFAYPASSDSCWMFDVCILGAKDSSLVEWWVEAHSTYPDIAIESGSRYSFHAPRRIPVTFALHQNYPNPFNPTTVIRYDVPQAGEVDLMIFNLLGQRVATLFDGRQLAGSHTINWNASNLPSGLYLCRMEAAGFVQTRKLLLVK